MNYIAVVRLTAYDTIAVTANSKEEAIDEVRRILRDEQKYEQRQVRPLLAEVESLREEDVTSEVVWRRGEDPLKRLLVSPIT